LARLRGCIWLIAGLLIAVLAGVMAYLYLGQAAEQSAEVAVDTTPRVQVVVAARAVPLRAQLTEADLRLAEFAVETVPQGALASVPDAVGRITMVELYPGEPVLAQRLVDPNYVSGDGRTALVLAPEEILMAFPATDLLSTLTVLKPGDRVDLYISLEIPWGRELAATGAAATTAATAGTGAVTELTTFIVLQNVGIAALPGSIPEQAPEEQAAAGLIPGDTQPQQQAATQPPTAILFTMAPQDALVLKYIMDKGAVQSIVLRAPGADTPFETEPVNIDYVINRFNLPTEIGR
jgi:Flp pilus assembly protein CpaB